MERWSTWNDGPDLYDVDIVQTFKSNKKLCLDPDLSVKHGNADDCSERLRRLFDQVLFVFWGEVSREKCNRPTPALLGSGQPADFFKLFWVVRKRGGYDSVSRNGLWAFVAEECGLDGGAMAAVKLIYSKYLNELEQWLRKAIKGKSLENGESEIGGKFGLLLLELQEEFRGLLCDEQDAKKKDGKLVELKWKKNAKSIDFDIDKREPFFPAAFPAARGINEVDFIPEKNINDNEEKNCFHDEKNVSVSNTPVVKIANVSQKRKQGSLDLLGMLNWVSEIAKHSNDPAIGRIPYCSKWKDYSRNEFWVQALLAREVRLRRRPIDSNTEESVLQKKVKMHPSFYEDSDALIPRSPEGVRCRERQTSFTKPRFCPCCNSCSASPSTQNKVLAAYKVEVEDKPKEQPHLSVDKRRTNQIDGISNDEPFQKHVFVGPLFQAEVPEWTCFSAGSDSKWLGTRLWPPQYRKHKPLIGMDPIGKGKEDSCSCQIPGSISCIRFHVAENRMKLKLELGSLFYQWGFDRMGEEVSLAWTMEEEKRFKDVIRLKPPSLNKFFWDVDVFKLFPTKTREKLVRYYLNVFLVRRRAYQNRVTPKDIDSDDDETEFGCVGGGYGYETVNVSGSKLLICAENKQCIDF